MLLLYSIHIAVTVCVLTYILFIHSSSIVSPIPSLSQAPNPRGQLSSSGGVPLPSTRNDHPDSGNQALPPPIPVVGRLLVRGKFEFKSVSYNINIMSSSPYTTFTALPLNSAPSPISKLHPFPFLPSPFDVLVVVSKQVITGPHLTTVPIISALVIF